MEYVDVSDAIALSGLRLVLTAGVPGPWGEAAKAIFQVKEIPFTPVRQTAGEQNRELLEWTGQSGAPAAMYGDERPRTGWAEILLLAERLSPEPRLIPADAEERSTMFGLCHEICGEEGFGWSRRLMIFDPILRAGTIDKSNPFPWKYGYSPAAADAAAQRVVDLLAMFAARLHRQQANQSRFFIGAGLTAADLYWAAFASMLVPMPAPRCPMTDSMRDLYDIHAAARPVEFDPILLEHRDYVYDTFVGLPMDF